MMATWIYSKWPFYLVVWPAAKNGHYQTSFHLDVSNKKQASSAFLLLEGWIVLARPLQNIYAYHKKTS